jgi:type VI secretion system secreted protein VgrG
MLTNLQINRPMAVTTPLGADRLLLAGFSGQEGLSQLFTFHLDVLAEHPTDVPFEKLLGQPVGIRLSLALGRQRFFWGICSRLSQGESKRRLTDYRLEVVPALWLLTRRSQSRVFQHQSVPDILREVLQGLDVVYQIQGTFQPRDYCVQYRESDFAFASRLMEEEGIYYFFTHDEKGHRLMLANTPASHPELPGGPLVYRNLSPDTLAADVIYDWSKSQELSPGKYTLWDHCFELPHQHLEAGRPLPTSVPVGRADHKLRLPANDRLEIFDWPGGYAQRFDGIDRGGAERPAELSKIFEDNRRTVEIRMQEGAAASLTLRGASNCRPLAAGHRFTLATVPTDPLTRPQKVEGTYVLTSVVHSARQGGYRSGEGIGFEYHNRFTCIPAALPFRPPRVTPRPVAHGTQTAVVVPPTGGEVATDKYGRVKVRFHWDRAPKDDGDRSCWVRVAQLWAGKRFGAHFWPRAGQEVIVAFEEGDPNQPIIVGSVYNAENMPPYALPQYQTRSGIKTHSTPWGTAEQFNELRFDDKKGHEEIYLHAERNLTTVVESAESRSVGGQRTTTIDQGDNLTIKKDGRETTIQQGADILHVDHGPRETYVEQAWDLHQVNGQEAVLNVPNGARRVTAKEVFISALDRITLSVGISSLVLEPGKIRLSVPTSEITLEPGKIAIAVPPSNITLDTAGVSTYANLVKAVAALAHEVKGLPVLINC